MLAYTVRTHRGCIRETNEDRFFIPPPEGPFIFAVADGMGGHAAGEVASSLAIKILSRRVKDIAEDYHHFAPGQVKDFLLSTIQQANTEIVRAQEQQSELEGMGTTLTAIYICGRELLTGHVGDSQAYIFRNGGYFQITEDHSLVMELVKNGEIKAEEAYTHPQRHLITRFLGISSPLHIDLYVTAFQPGDYLLLCTDGLTAMLRPSEIGELLFDNKEKGLETTADELLFTANARGGSDNITFALISLF